MQLDDEQVNGQELLTAEVLFLETGHFGRLLSNRATLNRCLLVDTVDFDENFGNLAQAQLLVQKKMFDILQEKLLVKLSVQETQLRFARVYSMVQEALEGDFHGKTFLH